MGAETHPESDDANNAGADAARNALPDPAVLFAGASFVVIDKPAGMLSVPGKGSGKQDCAVGRVRRMFPRAQGPMVVHRLDMETSGLLVVALTAEAQRELSMQFEQRRTEKAYTALLDGLIGPDAGVIDLPLRPDLQNRPVQIIDHALGRPATTRFTVLARETDRTRVRFEPVTGRTHQLRVHAAAHTPDGLGAPILGDLLYGRRDNAERLMLHATELTLLDPETGRRAEFRSAPPF